MITTSQTKRRILTAMEHGAKLVAHYSTDYEGGSYLDGYTLEKNGRSLKLGDLSGIAKEIIKSNDIREGYIFNSEYGREYRQMYEHANIPVPRWVSEQWGFDNDGNLISPDDQPLAP